MLETVWLQLRPALILARREVRDQFRDWRVIFPIVVLTLFFPALMNYTAQQALSFVERYGAPIIGERLIPFLLMVVGFFPISISLVIALESFVGEKERHSIEPLLSSPLSDWHLYWGKLLAALIVPLLASYLGIGVYLIGILLKINWRPDFLLLFQILLLTAVQAVVMVSGAVVVSTQTTSVRAANLLASFIVIPMAMLIQGESVVMFWARYSGLWWVIGGQIVIAALLVRVGVAHFNREELLGRDLDVLNLRWGWGVFKSAFLAGARSLREWYARLFHLVGQMRLPLGLMVLALAVAMWIGQTQARVFVLPSDLLDWRQLDQGFLKSLGAWRFFSLAGVGAVWLHNARAILLATALGLFTFGVLGVIVLMIPLALVGYFAASLGNAGLSPFVFLMALVLPHGILEIPAMILSGAAVLRLGATLVTPAQDQSIGEAWLRSLADWARVIVGLVLPLLLGAAALEVLLTPRVALLILGG